MNTYVKLQKAAAASASKTARANKARKFSFEQAEKIAKRLGKKLILQIGSRFTGVGIEPHPEEGYRLSVRVEHGTVAGEGLAKCSRFEGIQVDVLERAIARPRKATKAELRAEIAGLRRIGRQLANCAYNLAQSDMIDSRQRLTLVTCYKDWDKITRSEQA